MSIRALKDVVSAACLIVAHGLHANVTSTPRPPTGCWVFTWRFWCEAPGPERSSDLVQE